MATLSSLGQMMLALPPQVPQYDPQQVALTQQRLQAGRLGQETGLLQLEELRRQQASEAAFRQAVSQNPGLLLGGGGATLGTLGQAGPPGAITQGPLPGQAGPTQTIGAPQDVSQYASGPPQRALGSLQGPPQDPLRALMQQDPDAGLKMLDLRAKVQERVLGMQEKKLAAFGQILQGATDQASWDQAREQIRQVDPPAAARMSPFFSAEERDRWVMQAQSVKDTLTLRLQDLGAQADLMKARMSGRVPKTDQYLKALGVTPGQETPEDMRKALAWQQQDEIAVSSMHGAGQIKDTPAGAVRIRPSGDVEYLKGPQGEPIHGKPTEQEQKAATFGNLATSAHQTAIALEKKGFTPSFWEQHAGKLPLGLDKYLTSDDYQKYRQAVLEFAQAWLYKTSGAQVTEQEWERTNQTYFPQPGESQAQIEYKRQRREEVIQNLQEEGKTTGRVRASGSPTSPAPAGGKVVSRAALHAEADRRGVPREQAEQQARTKGYEVR